MGVKERKGTGKTMRSPGVAWKCQEWENWLFPSKVYSTRWEVSQRRLLSSGVSENCGGATWSRVLECLAPLAPRKIPPVASQGDRGICCRPRWDLREACRRMPSFGWPCKIMVIPNHSIRRSHGVDVLGRITTTGRLVRLYISATPSVDTSAISSCLGFPRHVLQLIMW